MTKRLILMRHAKSDWDSPELADHDRPLNRRGRAAAPEMADWMVEQGFVPGRILCSSSARTQQTAQLMLAQWNNDVELLVSRELYLASPERILHSVCCDGGDAVAVMVLAHNPGMEAMVSHLANELVSFPTAAVAVFEMAIEDWTQLQTERCIGCLAIQRPKEL